MFRSKSEDEQFSRVADFYNGKTVFLTGASGFVGSVLLEILLRCCPGIKSIYILLRSKKNVQPEVRKEQIFNKKIFEKMKEENPELFRKVHVIPGDGSLPNLGMSDEDAFVLTQEVSIVFHCAAIVNFTKPLRFILLHNVLSLNSVIELCRRMKKLEALVYTSTAYSNCNHTKFNLKEEVYRLPFRSEKFLDAVKNENKKELVELFNHCKPEWPNTYTFSKCLAENLIMDTASDLPIAIIRPSIVISTCIEPSPGYVEEKSGMAGLAIGVGKGFVKVLFADPNNKLNMVPADIVARAHVLAAWSLGTKRCVSPYIVNCTATEKLHVMMSDYVEILTELCYKFPLPRSFREYNGCILVSNKYLYYTFAFYYHYLPAAVLDGILKILGKKPKVYSMYSFFDTVMSCLNFFLFHTLEFERDNLKNLDKLLHPEDRKNLSVDFSDITFREIMYKVSEVSPFYDWKIDKRTQSERQKISYRRHIITIGIQVMFLIIFLTLLYWIISSVFHS